MPKYKDKGNSEPCTNGRNSINFEQKIKNKCLLNTNFEKKNQFIEKVITLLKRETSKLQQDINLRSIA
jgi:hypothetical protein